MRTLAWSAALLGAALIGCSNPRTREAPAKWARVQNVAAETVEMEFADRKGVATYYVASPAAPLGATVTGPARLRLYVSPEFSHAAAPPSETRVTVAIGGSPDRTIVVQSMPSTARRFRKGKGAVPGEVHTSFLDVPAGDHALRISADSRVAVQLHLSK